MLDDSCELESAVLSEEAAETDELLSAFELEDEADEEESPQPARQAAQSTAAAMIDINFFILHYSFVF